ncbi:MAG: alanine racemase [Deltaproteobacteria bacterium]|nr:alanine racemase [Deltaproteobacteria bacterium]
MASSPVSAQELDSRHPGSAGPELRVVRPRRARPAEAARATRAEINLAHVRHNLRELQACVRADAAAAQRLEVAQVWCVLKADGYGHGARAVAITLEHAGVAGLCVALLEEGMELRNAGVRCPVLVMGGYWGRHRDGVEALLENDLTPVIYDEHQISTLTATARYLYPEERRPIDVHLKVDTGMGRLGVREEGLGDVLAALRAAPELQLGGLMTHLACADSESLDQTHEQLAAFERATDVVHQLGFRPAVRHAANSAALLRAPRTHFDVVRPGIAVFGVHPCPSGSHESARAANLRPVMRVLSEVVALRELPVGQALGYDHSWRATRPSRIATIPMGYADGLSRALSNRGQVLVCGKRAPIVGHVSMDLTMVDVTDIPGVCVRDEVVVLGEQHGRQGSDHISADDLASQSGTVAWECLTSVSRRVPRFYRHP